MMEFRDWKITAPTDVEAFDQETLYNHQTSTDTLYSIGEGNQQKLVSREQFLAYLRSLTRNHAAPARDAWCCQQYQGGGPILFECWTAPTQEDKPEGRSQPTPASMPAF